MKFFYFICNVKICFGDEKLIVFWWCKQLADTSNFIEIMFSW